MIDVKMSDRPLWIDCNGHKTLDNWSKQAMAYYHVEDVKCLREDATAMVERIQQLEAALFDVLDCVDQDLIEDALKIIKQVSLQP